MLDTRTDPYAAAPGLGAPFGGPGPGRVTTGLFSVCGNPAGVAPIPA